MLIVSAARANSDGDVDRSSIQFRNLPSTTPRGKVLRRRIRIVLVDSEDIIQSTSLQEPPEIKQQYIRGRPFFIRIGVGGAGAGTHIRVRWWRRLWER